jgi:hypothetical protein
MCVCVCVCVRVCVYVETSRMLRSEKDMIREAFACVCVCVCVWACVCMYVQTSRMWKSEKDMLEELLPVCVGAYLRIYVCVQCMPQINTFRQKN